MQIGMTIVDYMCRRAEIIGDDGHYKVKHQDSRLCRTTLPKWKAHLGMLYLVISFTYLASSLINPSCFLSGIRF
jgi:hypothetical protein